MADRELVITLRLAKAAAEQQARQFHEGERAQIKETSSVEASDLKGRMALTKQFFKEATDAQKQYARATEQANRALTRQAIEDEKRVAAERKKSQQEAANDLKSRMALTKQYFREAAEAEARSTAARKQAVLNNLKETTAAVRESIEEGRRVEKVATDAGTAGMEAQRKIVRMTRAEKLAALKETTASIRESIKEGDEKVKQVGRVSEAIVGSNLRVVRASREQREAAAKANSEGVDGARRVTNAIQKQQEGIMRISTAYTAMRLAAEVGQNVHAAFQAAADSLRETKDHIRGMVEETERLRDRLAEIHAMRGAPSSAMSTAEDLAFYARAGVTPEQGIQAQDEFLAQAGGMVEPVGTPEARKSEYRLDAGRAEELQGFAMSAGAAQGIEPAAAMMLMSTFIAKGDRGPDGKVDVGKVKEQFSRNMGLFQREKGHTAQDVRQFADFALKNARSSADIDRMAVMHGAQTEIGPGRSRVNMDALIRGIDQLTEEKRGELGITEGMTNQESLAAATSAIPRLALARAGGHFRDAAQQHDMEMLVGRRYFNQQHEIDAFMAHLEQGVRGGTYERLRGEQAAGSAAVMQRQIDQYRSGRRGVAARQASDLARARAERAADYENLTAARRQAAIGVVRGGEVEEPEGFFMAMATRAGEQFGQGNRFEQEVERNQIQQTVAGLRNFPEGREWLRRNGTPGVMSPEPLKARAANFLARLKSSGARSDGGGNPPGPGANAAAEARDINRFRNEGFVGPGAIPAPHRASHVVIPPGLMESDAFEGAGGQGRRHGGHARPHHVAHHAAHRRHHGGRVRLGNHVMDAQVHGFDAGDPDMRLNPIDRAQRMGERAVRMRAIDFRKRVAEEYKKADGGQNAANLKFLEDYRHRQASWNWDMLARNSGAARLAGAPSAPPARAHAPRHGFALGGASSPGGGEGAARELVAAARELKESARPHVPPALPGSPFRIQ